MPDEIEKRLTRDRFRRNARVSFDPPAQVGRVPGVQPVAARRDPEEAEHQGRAPADIPTTEAALVVFAPSVSGVA